MENVQSEVPSLTAPNHSGYVLSTSQVPEKLQFLKIIHRGETILVLFPYISPFSNEPPKKCRTLLVPILSDSPPKSTVPRISNDLLFIESKGISFTEKMLILFLVAKAVEENVGIIKRAQISVINDLCEKYSIIIYVILYSKIAHLLNYQAGG